MQSQSGLVASHVLSAAAPSEPARAHVTARLEGFRVLQKRWMDRLLAALPAAIAFLLLADSLVGFGVYTGDPFLLSAASGVILVLLILRLLFDRFPRALLTLWTRQLFLPGPGGEPVDDRLLAFVGEVEKRMNHRAAWAVGLVLGLLAVGLTYPVMYFLNTGRSPFSAAELLGYYLLGHPIYLYLFVGWFAGLLLWKAGVIANAIARLGQSFELKIQPNHPDRSGGLRDIGNLTLLLALLLLIPAVYLSVWAFAGTWLGPDARWSIYDTLWSPYFRQLLAVLLILEVLLFFVPLYSIHRQMERRRVEIQVELDRLSQEMDQVLLDLRQNATGLTPQQGAEKLEMIKFLQNVYQENQNVPTWPFDWKMLARFASVQAVPVISWIGTSSPVVSVIKTILEGFAK